MEGAGEGIASYPDDFYRAWPEPWTNADIAGGWYLKSLTPKEEFAAFLVTRACCLEDNGRLADAVQAYCWARDLAPHDGRYVQIAFHRAHKLECQREMSVASLLEANRRAREARVQVDQPRDPTQKQNVETPAHLESGCCTGCAGAKRSGVPIPFGFDHGPSCQCFHCRQYRRSGSHGGAVLPFTTGCIAGDIYNRQYVEAAVDRNTTAQKFLSP